MFDAIKSVDSVQSVGYGKTNISNASYHLNIFKVNQQGCKLFDYCDIVSIGKCFVVVVVKVLYEKKRKALKHYLLYNNVSVPDPALFSGSGQEGHDLNLELRI